MVNISRILISKILLLIVLVNPVVGCSQSDQKEKETQDTSRKPSGIWTLEWSPNDKYFALGGDDSLVWVYSGVDATFLKTYRMKHMVRGMKWHPDGKTLAVSTMNNAAEFLNIETGKISVLNDAKYGARGIGWNYNAELLATADGGGVINIWKSKGEFIKTIKKETRDSYLAMVWHPSRNIIVAAGSEIWMFDTTGKQLLQAKHRTDIIAGVLTVSWHPSGDFFATGDTGADDVESLIQFWNEKGEIFKTLHGSKAEYRNIRWNKDGSLLASASDALRIWKKDGELIATGLSDYKLWGIAWNSKGDRIVTASFNGQVKLWTKDAQLIKSIH